MKKTLATLAAVLMATSAMAVTATITIEARASSEVIVLSDANTARILAALNTEGYSELAGFKAWLIKSMRELVFDSEEDAIRDTHRAEQDAEQAAIPDFGE